MMSSSAGSGRRIAERMGYVLRAKASSFLTGAAVASILGFCVLYKDYKVAQESISHEMKGLHESFDRRISALETLKQNEVTEHAETTG